MTAHEPQGAESFIDAAIEDRGKLAYCTARIKRVVGILESNDAPDRELLLRLLREALQECRRDWRQ